MAKQPKAPKPVKPPKPPKVKPSVVIELDEGQYTIELSLRDQEDPTAPIDEREYKLVAIQNGAKAVWAGRLSQIEEELGAAMDQCEALRSAEPVPEVTPTEPPPVS